MHTDEPKHKVNLINKTNKSFAVHSETTNPMYTSSNLFAVIPQNNDCNPTELTCYFESPLFFILSDEKNFSKIRSLLRIDASALRPYGTYSIAFDKRKGKYILEPIGSTDAQTTPKSLCSPTADNTKLQDLCFSTAITHNINMTPIPHSIQQSCLNRLEPQPLYLADITQKESRTRHDAPHIPKRACVRGPGIGRTIVNLPE